MEPWQLAYECLSCCVQRWSDQFCLMEFGWFVSVARGLCALRRRLPASTNVRDCVCIGMIGSKSWAACIRYVHVQTMLHRAPRKCSKSRCNFTTARNGNCRLLVLGCRRPQQRRTRYLLILEGGTYVPHAARLHSCCNVNGSTSKSRQQPAVLCKYSSIFFPIPSLARTATPWLLPLLSLQAHAQASASH